MISNDADHLAIRRTRRLEALALAVGIGIVAFAYLDSLDGPFIWDDLELLKQPCIRSACRVSEYFELPFWGGQIPGSGMLYRPLTSLSLAFDNVLHGQNSAGFHITNILFHLLNVGLLAILARRLGANGLVAASMATVWGLLPRLSESVAWISGRTDILYSSAAVLALLVWKSDRPGRRILAVALGLVSALAKEAGVSVLIGLVFAEVLAPRRGRIARALIPGLVLAGYLALRQTVAPLVARNSTIPLSFTRRIVTVFEAVGRYSWMSVDLWHPKAQIGVVGEPRLGYVWLGLVVVVLAAILAFCLRRHRDPFVILVTIVGVVPMLLVVHLLPMPWVAVVGDRLGYLSWGIGACGIAAAFAIVTAKTRLGTPFFVVPVLALIVTLVPSVQRRVHLFSDEIAFWVQAVSETASSNWGPTINLSGLYLRAGLPDESLAILDSLEKRCRSTADVETDTASAKALARRGDYREAEKRVLSRPIAKSPDLVLAYARLRLAQADVGSAEALTERVLQGQPDSQDAGQFLDTLQRVKRLSLELKSSNDPFSRSVLEAQINMLSGRLIQAESKWQPLLSNPDLPKPASDEAIAFECALGSAAVVRQVVFEYGSRLDFEPSLIRACQDKIKFAERLQAGWPEVTQILARKNSNAGHCQEYGPFSD